MSRYIYILVLSLAMVCHLSPVAAQTDTAGTEETDKAPAKKKFTGGHQLTIGADIFHPVLNQYASNRYSYEGEVSYYLKNEYYLVAEGGWGGSDVSFDDLKYKTTNYFGRLGFNKSILYRESNKDWDMMFMGLRAAMSNVNRGDAVYTTTDSVWGNTTGISAGQNFAAVWAELTVGMRVELVHGIMAGWNMRGKFLMNGRSFSSLAPFQIAGYGKGDKSTNFDFNLYVCYAIRWNKQQPAATPADKK